MPERTLEELRDLAEKWRQEERRDGGTSFVPAWVFQLLRDLVDTVTEQQAQIDGLKSSHDELRRLLGSEGKVAV